jgi:hypothetical protein
MLKWALMLLGAVVVHGFALPSAPGLRTRRNEVAISCGARMASNRDAWHKDRQHNLFQFKGRSLTGGRGGKENAGAMSGTSTLTMEKLVASDTNGDENLRQASASSHNGDELAMEMFKRFDNYRASAMKETRDASAAFARFDEFLNGFKNSD